MLAAACPSQAETFVKWKNVLTANGTNTIYDVNPDQRLDGDGEASRFQRPRALAVDRHNNLLVYDQGWLRWVSTRTGQSGYTLTHVGDTGLGSDVCTLAVAADDSIYLGIEDISTTAGNRVVKLFPSGQEDLLFNFIRPNPADYFHVQQVTVAHDQTLFVSGLLRDNLSSNNRVAIYKCDADGRATQFYLGPDVHSAPPRTCVDPTGYLVFYQSENSSPPMRFKRIDVLGNVTNWSTSTAQGALPAYRMTVLSDGSIVVHLGGGPSVAFLRQDGVIVEKNGSPTLPYITDGNWRPDSLMGFQNFGVDSDIVSVGKVAYFIDGTDGGPQSEHVVRTMDDTGVGTLSGLKPRAMADVLTMTKPSGMTWDGSNSRVIVTDRVKNSLYAVKYGIAITALAGDFINGTIGSADGSLTSATFNGPTGVATSTTGVIYVADTGNSTIRKVDPGANAVTTLAGSAGQQGLVDNTGSLARFKSPEGIVCTGSGSTFAVWVADTGNNCIRKITSAGVVTTVAIAGSTVGSLSSPRGIWSDGTNLYVADCGNSRIVKIVIGGFAGTVVTTGTTDIWGLSGYKVSSSLTELYWTARASHKAYITSLAGTTTITVTTKQIAGLGTLPLSQGAATQMDSAWDGYYTWLESPEGICFNTASGLWLADTDGGGMTPEFKGRILAGERITPSLPLSATATVVTTAANPPGSSNITLTCTPANGPTGVAEGYFEWGDSLDCLNQAGNSTSAPFTGVPKTTTLGTLSPGVKYYCRYTLRRVVSGTTTYLRSPITTFTMAGFSSSVAVSSAGVPGISLSGLAINGTSLSYTVAYAPAAGETVTLIQNTGSAPILGRFTNLEDGAAVTLTTGGSPHLYTVSYSGGDGNDLTLTRALWEDLANNCAVTEISPWPLPADSSYITLRGTGLDAISTLDMRVGNGDPLYGYYTVPILNTAVTPLPPGSDKMFTAFMPNIQFDGPNLTLQINGSDARVHTSSSGIDYQYNQALTGSEWPVQGEVMAFGMSPAPTALAAFSSINGRRSVSISQRGPLGIKVANAADDFMFIGKKWEHFATPNEPAYGKIEAGVLPFQSGALPSAVSGIMLRVGGMDDAGNAFARAPYLFIGRTGDQKIVVRKRAQYGTPSVELGSVAIPAGNQNYAVYFRLERAPANTIAYSYNGSTWNYLATNGSWGTTAVTIADALNFSQAVSAGIVLASGDRNTVSNGQIYGWTAWRKNPVLGQRFALSGPVGITLPPMAMKFDPSGTRILMLARGTGVDINKLYVLNYSWEYTPVSNLDLAQLTCLSSTALTAATTFDGDVPSVSDVVPGAGLLTGQDYFVVGSDGAAYLSCSFGPSNSSLARILRIDPATGVFTRVAGSSDASDEYNYYDNDPFHKVYRFPMSITSTGPDYRYGTGVSLYTMDEGAYESRLGGFGSIFRRSLNAQASSAAFYDDGMQFVYNPRVASSTLLRSSRFGGLVTSCWGALSDDNPKFLNPGDIVLGGKYGSPSGYSAGTNIWHNSVGNGVLANSANVRLRGENMCVDEDGTIYVADLWGNPGNAPPSGVAVTYNDSSGLAAHASIRRIAVEGFGSGGGTYIRKIAGTGSRVTPAVNAASTATAIGLNDAQLMIVDRQGTLLFFDGTSLRVLRQ